MAKNRADSGEAEVPRLPPKCLPPPGRGRSRVHYSPRREFLFSGQSFLRVGMRTARGTLVNELWVPPQ
jgi:hypothetical protein